MTSDQLFTQFTKVARQVETTVEIVGKNAHEVQAALQRATSGAGTIVVAQPDDLDPELFELFKQSERVINDPDDKQLAEAQYGVTDAFAAIARTGSICVSMSEKMGGSYSLFPRTHIAVVDLQTLVARPRDIFLQEPLRSKAMNRDFVFISGSSATADMGPLVRGVHGPGRLHVIFLK